MRFPTAAQMRAPIAVDRDLAIRKNHEASRSGRVSRFRKFPLSEPSPEAGAPPGIYRQLLYKKLKRLGIE
jgi:hypothetical protein